MEGQESLLLPLQAKLFHHEVDLTQLHVVVGKQRVVANGTILPTDSNGGVYVLSGEEDAPVAPMN